MQWPDGPVYRCVLFASTDHKDKPVCLCACKFGPAHIPSRNSGRMVSSALADRTLVQEWKSLNSLNKFNTEYSTIAETLIWGSLLAATLKRWLINETQQKLSASVVHVQRGQNSQSVVASLFCIKWACSGITEIAAELGKVFAFLAEHCQG